MGDSTYIRSNQYLHTKEPLCIPVLSGTSCIYFTSILRKPLKKISSGHDPLSSIVSCHVLAFNDATLLYNAVWSPCTPIIMAVLYFITYTSKRKYQLPMPNLEIFFATYPSSERITAASLLLHILMNFEGHRRSRVETAIYHHLLSLHLTNLSQQSFVMGYQISALWYMDGCLDDTVGQAIAAAETYWASVFPSRNNFGAK